MNTVEEKRAIFHRYLEQSGVIEALSQALIKLYEEQDKPDDPVKFVRQHMKGKCEGDSGGGGGEDGAGEDGAGEDGAGCSLAIDETEKCANDEASELKNDDSKLVGSPPEFPTDNENLQSELNETTDTWILQGFQAITANPDCVSMLKQFISEEQLVACASQSVAASQALYHCIRPGLENIEQPIGLLAIDGSAYSMLSIVFDIVMEAIHGSAGNAATDWGAAVDTFAALGDTFVRSITFGCRLAVADLPFVGMSVEQLTEISDKAREMTEGRGIFTNLADINDEYLTELTDSGNAFTNDNNYLRTAGAYDHWPCGRAIFVSDDKSMVIWVNREDHLQFTSKQTNGNFGLAFQTLSEYVELFATQWSYAQHDRWGWLTMCPSNAGAASLEASAHLYLPKLTQEAANIDEIVQKHELTWERQNDETMVYLSVKRKMGATEFEVAKTLYDCIVELISSEAAD